MALVTLLWTIKAFGTGSFSFLLLRYDLSQLENGITLFDPQDPDYDFDFVVEDMDEKVCNFLEFLILLVAQDDFDVGKFLSIINKQHSESRTYKCSADALQEVKVVKKKLKSIDEESNFG